MEPAPTPTQPEPVIIHPQPAQSPNSQAPAAQTPPPPVIYPKSTTKIFFTAFIILFLLSAVTIGTAITSGYYDYPIYTPPKAVKDAIDKTIAISPLPKPKRLIIESAFAKTTAIKSADIKTEFSMTTASKDSPIKYIKLTVAGPADLEKSKTAATEFDIGMEIGMEGANFNGSASVKTVSERIYFKVNEIPFGTMYKELFDYKDKWFYWDPPQEFKQKALDKEHEANVNKLITAFIQNSRSWTTVTSKEGPHYTLDINPPKEEVANFVYDIIQIYEPKDQAKINTDLEKETITEALNKMGGIKLTMKIEKDSYYLSSINAQFELSTSNMSMPTRSESLLPVDQTILNFNISAELSNYNRTIVISPPPDAINIETALGEIGNKFSQDLGLPPNGPSPDPLLPLTPSDDIPEGTGGGDIQDEQSLRQLISPEETILGEKYAWEKELFKLFSQVFN